MAGELKVGVFSLIFEKQGRHFSFSQAAQRIAVAGLDVVHKTQNIGTSEEALDMGDVTTPGWLFLRNLDNTNYVSMRPATGVVDCLEWKAGEAFMCRLARGATAPFMIANTAAVEVEYLLIED